MTIISKLVQLPSPFPRGWRWADYLAVRRAPPLTAGQTRILGYPVHYSDRVGLVHSVKEIMVDEVYRFDAANDRPHIIDAGANIGLSVIYFKQLYPECSIVAFEPDPQIFSLLEQNVSAFADIDLRQQAAWVEDTMLTFFSEGSLAGSVEVDYRSAGQAMTVSACRLKDELAKRPVDFLKIDIEGAENSVLFDIEDELDNVRHLFFEYHSLPGQAQKLGAMLDLVTRKGFRYAINGTHTARRPFIDRSYANFDLQLNVLCYRPG